MNLHTIDQALLDALSAQAAALPRRRKNHNFHATDAHACHRLLNAIEPDSYVVPHRHLDPAKDETMLIIRGRLGMVFFDADGTVVERKLLEAGGVLGVTIPPGTFHTVLALEPATVFFEAKAGPYLPLTEAERAQWAPAEGSPDAGAWLARLHALFVDKG